MPPARLVEIDGQPLHLAVWPGKADAPPMMIFNGFGCGIELLDPLAGALGYGEVIAFDMPGVGESPAATRPARFRELARLACGVLDHLGHHGPVDIMGISWGGGLAQEFAHRHPARCRRLVLAATSAGAFMLPGSPLAWWRQLAPHRPATEGMPGTHFNSLGGCLAQLYAVAGWSSVHWLHRLHQPSLVLVGRHDTLVPAGNGRLLQRRIPNARLVEIDGDHMFALSCASDVAAQVRSFLAGR